MDNCDEMKSNIDQFLTISDDQKTTIEEHISKCKTCAEYKAVAEQSSKIFSSMNSSSLKIPAIEAVYKSLDKQTKVMRRQTSFALAGLFTSVIALVWFLINGAGENSAFVNITMVFVCFAFAYTVRNTSQKAQKYLNLRDSGDFINHWKKEVAENIKETAIIGPVAAVFFFVLPLWVLIRDGMQVNYKFITILSVALIASMFVLYRYLIVLPQLKKELELLDSGEL
ncbi:MAG: hypothetical protein DRQ47_00225 [Gammaproteobacteria bacterium]|nr:MAG: hypothetical protein DRQ47_00225 [Gammaproteobacteria bacterium]